ncbi:phosphogluconate dehydratase [Tolumonas osonensis]|uniref:Phosphogluconate dehydratase n=1 Tax=Tolumonas osonensis TaxID=675874 RepID=A0A841GJ85_9GAMM|nr:phosphogluconate dehydratase [Tolumonas osonensis]MBB6054910.1 phosphogluconate dehydratase [Tolumonas osonensis]
MHPVIRQVTERIRQRSAQSRQQYIALMQQQAMEGRPRAQLACGNLAHVVAACPQAQKSTLLDMTRCNVAIITAYNDMLSAHQPYADYPAQIKAVVSALGHSAQVAGGVPAMCDGVTQGQPGMDLSLFSRDVIAQATAVSLSHNAFDATLLLGICDKIAPGQLMGALAFGHLPTAFIPAGPMSTGISNEEKVNIRQQYAAGKLGRDALQNMENQAYHSHGTCTFYGTANTNQLVFEAMGLMLPGSAFVHPDDPLRLALTEKASSLITSQVAGSSQYRPLWQIVDERSLVNGLVALLASGGSTNHTLHMVAVARAAGLLLTWDDFSDLSDVVPLLARVYPNGPADINAFHQAGGVPLLLKRLADRGLLNTDAQTFSGDFSAHFHQPFLDNGKLYWQEVGESKHPDVIAAKDQAFNVSGGLKLLSGNLGRAVIKVSAVAPEHQIVEADALIFDSQHDVETAYKAGQLNRDAIIVVRFSGPAANGMPELHKLMPILGNVQKAGYKVALVTDGRLSGASGKIPAAIHVTPEAAKGGPLAHLKTGDRILLDATEGKLEVLTDISQRATAKPDLHNQHRGMGREYFSLFRQNVSSAEQGACVLFADNTD